MHSYYLSIYFKTATLNAHNSKTFAGYFNLSLGTWLAFHLEPSLSIDLWARTTRDWESTQDQDERASCGQVLPSVSDSAETRQEAVPWCGGQETVSEVLLWPVWWGVPEEVLPPAPCHHHTREQDQELQKMWIEKLLLSKTEFCIKENTIIDNRVVSVLKMWSHITLIT